MPDEYEGELDVSIVVSIQHVPWHSQQSVEKSREAMREIVLQEFTDKVRDISDVQRMAAEADGNEVEKITVQSFRVLHHYGPDGEEV